MSLCPFIKCFSTNQLACTGEKWYKHISIRFKTNVTLFQFCPDTLDNGYGPILCVAKRLNNLYFNYFDPIYFFRFVKKWLKKILKLTTWNSANDVAWAWTYAAVTMPILNCEGSFLAIKYVNCTKILPIEIRCFFVSILLGIEISQNGKFEWFLQRNARF